MKISSQSVAALLILPSASAFIVPSSYSHSSALQAKSEFDYLLGEGTGTNTQNAIITSSKIDTDKIITLPDTTQAATLTSSITYDEASAATTSNDEFETEQDIQQEQDPRMAEIIRKEQQQMAIKAEPPTKTPLSIKTMNFLKGKDFGEIFFTVLVPLIGGYYFLNKGIASGKTKVDDKASEILEDYANEMIYHDGDFEEMKLAHADYGKKLVFLGTKKGDMMIKRYLEFYAKKKTVSPQAISSLSYVFSLYKLTEERAAEILAELCLSMPEKVASAGKLLFFGEHILKTPEGKAKLAPIKELLASVYRDDGVISGEEIVEKSQLAMAEAAYRAAVAAAGKKQSELTIGWEVLGLDEETAIKIFEEVAGEGFITQREAKYATKQQKYDDKGRKLDDDGNLENPDEADDEEEESTKASGNVQECTECGFTLFVAEGRDFKFFNSGFTCPECGASKDKFKAADI